ncbi:aminotransferase class I/II-fold pyridoxal phosphate-dependent enzyme [Paenibacillus sp. NPDC058071]|uniref:aminotransferase class I/II-fold pyridoxal phosphate-dependent enzyme n=1 Tax=Paenibacillus sp. NPDC058071 TaxID=3346326 RepID=UPI0036DB9BC8
MNLKNFLLEDYFDQHEFSTPYLLSQSDCESMTIKELLALEPGSEEVFLNGWLGYSEVRGALPLRERIAALYDNGEANHILVHAGAEEAIYNFMQIYLEPGDHVVYMSPAYQSLYEVASSLQCNVSPWRLQQGDEGWLLDLDELPKLITSRTKLLVLNTPHNPTGYMLSDEELIKIARIAEEHGIFVFCDQVYKGLEWDGSKHAWFSDLYDNSISLGVMSKAYGLAGLRIGWIMTRNQSVYDKMVKYKYYTTICSSAPSEYLSIIALKNQDKILKRNISLVQNNLAIADRFFEQHKDYFVYNKPMAGPIGFHRLNLEESIQDFSADLINKQGVLLLPGHVYEMDGNYFRMGYGRKNFKEGLTQFMQYFNEKIN